MKKLMTGLVTAIVTVAVSASLCTPALAEEAFSDVSRSSEQYQYIMQRGWDLIQYVGENYADPSRNRLECFMAPPVFPVD